MLWKSRQHLVHLPPRVQVRCAQNTLRVSLGNPAHPESRRAWKARRCPQLHLMTGERVSVRAWLGSCSLQREVRSERGWRGPDSAPPAVFPTMLFMLAGAGYPFKQDKSFHYFKIELRGRIKKRTQQLFLSRWQGNSQSVRQTPPQESQL